jgi:hypothetical protein
VTLKLEKWFTVLKRGNHFTEIKEDFSVKLKIVSVDYYFTPHQTPKNTKIISENHFTSKQTEAATNMGADYRC